MNKLSIFIATTPRKKVYAMYKKILSWMLHSKYSNWSARKPNYQRRVKDVLQGVRMNTVIQVEKLCCLRVYNC